ncbi:MAG: TlpA family protein disulfide reductase [Clostridiales bacterium]|nr:TlpA family protein disulfide reductase [Clostridiales bacterium]
MRRLLVTILLLVLLAGCNSQSGEDLNGNETELVEYNFPEENETNPGLNNFATLDLYANVVDQNIFRNHELNMLNVWGTFCSPCINEMPDLGEIYREYEPLGVNIVGIVVDVQKGDGTVDYDMLKKAQDIVEYTGANYSHLLYSDNLITSFLSEVQYIPHTVFVDSEGKIVSEVYVGSRSKEEWTEIIDSMR